MVVTGSQTFDVKEAETSNSMLMISSLSYGPDIPNEDDKSIIKRQVNVQRCLVFEVVFIKVVEYFTYFYLWMQGLDNFKTGSKETGGNRNVVPSQNAMNLMDCKEIKRNSVMRSQDNKTNHKQY